MPFSNLVAGFRFGSPRGGQSASPDAARPGDFGRGARVARRTQAGGAGLSRGSSLGEDRTMTTPRSSGRPIGSQPRAWGLRPPLVMLTWAVVGLSLLAGGAFAAFLLESRDTG